MWVTKDLPAFKAKRKMDRRVTYYSRNWDLLGKVRHPVDHDNRSPCAEKASNKKVTFEDLAPAGP